jgi:hypothetical protein
MPKLMSIFPPKLSNRAIISADSDGDDDPLNPEIVEISVKEIVPNTVRVDMIEKLLRFTILFDNDGIRNKTDPIKGKSNARINKIAGNEFPFS